jgi:hypothetical protein
MTGAVATLVGAVVIAALSTIGDFVWASWIPRHRWEYGLTHGTLLFLAIGLFLGALNGRAAAGAVGGAIAGAAAAGSFYLLAPFVGFASMFLAWMGVWLALALLHWRLAPQRLGPSEAVVRGLVAAIASGAAFYAVSGIWLPFRPAGWDYAWHFAAWTFAYLPGFAALVAGIPGRRPMPVTTRA